MGNSLYTYLERLELLAFFSAFPLVYALIFFIAGTFLQNKPGFKARLISSLPFSYALVGVLYLGYLLRSWYPDYSISHIMAETYQPFLKIWALLSLLFWTPFLSKKAAISLLHSFVFLFFIVRDLLTETLSANGDTHVIKNDMKVYTDSFLLNLVTFSIVFSASLVLYHLKNRKKSLPK